MVIRKATYFKLALKKLFNFPGTMTSRKFDVEKRAETDQCNRVEDVYEEGEDLTVEVRRDEGSEWREENDDRNADGQKLPTLDFGSRVGHELAPIKSWKYINLKTIKKILF